MLCVSWVLYLSGTVSNLYNLFSAALSDIFQVLYWSGKCCNSWGFFFYGLVTLLLHFMLVRNKFYHVWVFSHCFLKHPLSNMLRRNKEQGIWLSFNNFFTYLICYVLIKNIRQCILISFKHRLKIKVIYKHCTNCFRYAFKKSTHIDFGFLNPQPALFIQIWVKKLAFSDLCWYQE